MRINPQRPGRIGKSETNPSESFANAASTTFPVAQVTSFPTNVPVDRKSMTRRPRPANQPSWTRHAGAVQPADQPGAAQSALPCRPGLPESALCCKAKQLCAIGMPGMPPRLAQLAGCPNRLSYLQHVCSLLLTLQCSSSQAVPNKLLTLLP